MLFGSFGVRYCGAATGHPGRNARAASCISRRHRAREWNSDIGRRWRRGPRPPVDFLAQDSFHCEGRPIVEIGIFQVDSREFPGSNSFAWQEGYGAFAVGVSQKTTTVKYIHAQAEHHKRISFADELKN